MAGLPLADDAAGRRGAAADAPVLAGGSWAAAADLAGGRRAAAAPAVGAGQVATQLAQEGSALARTSPGSGLWLALALCLLIASDAIRRLTSRALWRWLLNAQIWLIPCVLLTTGALDQLSLLKEYANRQDVFDAALYQHVTLLFGTLLPGLLIGLPMGIAIWRRPRWQAPVFTFLNIIQTVPSVALFGLLIAPLAGLAHHFPWLAARVFPVPEWRQR